MKLIGGALLELRSKVEVEVFRLIGLGVNEEPSTADLIAYGGNSFHYLTNETRPRPPPSWSMWTPSLATFFSIQPLARQAISRSKRLSD